MDPFRFDGIARHLARSRSRRAVVAGSLGASVLGIVGISPDARAKKKKNGKKKTICHCPTNDPASCNTLKVSKKSRKQHLQHLCDYDGPCQPGVVGQCEQPIEGCTRDNECAADFVCRNLECVPGCQQAGDCDAAKADTCTDGACTCGDGPACSGAQVCQGGTCLCPDSGTCVVTPDSLGGWRVGKGVSFVDGPKAPPLGTGSVQIQTTTVAKATLKNPTFAGLPIEDLDVLEYSTYMQDGANTGVVVPAVKLPVLTGLTCSGCATFTTLVFEPVYTGTVLPKTWQEWNLLGADARWWSSKDLPNGINAFTSYVSWNDIKAAIPNAVINPDGLLLETGSGTDGAVGYVDDLVVNDQTFDFQPD